MCWNKTLSTQSVPLLCLQTLILLLVVNCEASDFTIHPPAVNPGILGERCFSHVRLVGREWTALVLVTSCLLCCVESSAVRRQVRRQELEPVQDCAGSLQADRRPEWPGAGGGCCHVNGDLPARRRESAFRLEPQGGLRPTVGQSCCVRLATSWCPLCCPVDVVWPSCCVSLWLAGCVVVCRLKYCTGG